MTRRPLIDQIAGHLDEGRLGRGICAGRGARATESDELVRRVRRRDGQPDLPSYFPRRIGDHPRRLGRDHRLADLRRRRRSAQQPVRRARRDVPEARGRRRHLRPRGVEALHVVRRAGRCLRLLDRLVGRAGDQRPDRRPAPAEPVLHRLAGRGLELDAPHVAHPRGELRPQLPDHRRHLPHRLHLGRERVRCAAGGVGRLRHGRAAPVPARRAHHRAVPHGRLELVAPAQQHPPAELAHGRHGHPPRDRLALHHVLVVLRLRVLRDLRTRVQGSGARHGEGAARRSRVLDLRVRPLAARSRRHVRRHQDHRWQRALLLRRRVQDARGQHLGGCPRADALRGHRAVDEHGDDGRITSVVRHLAGRHDVPLPREAERAERAGERDDARRRPQRDPARVRDRRPSGVATSRSSRSRTSGTCSRTCSRSRASCSCAGIGRTGRDRSRSALRGSRSRGSASSTTSSCWSSAPSRSSSPGTARAGRSSSGRSWSRSSRSSHTSGASSSRTRSPSSGGFQHPPRWKKRRRCTPPARQATTA